MKKLSELFGEKLFVVNAGIAMFAENIRKAGGEAADIEWRPPAKGNAEILKKIKKIKFGTKKAGG